ncbi:hypothetical protein DFA_11329 [Cavenderia fasciculata]|uniref:EF-hand domain-containing protein n=1 Tax=Cavenderia fasciculata TaxID=261658 RepID=F4QCD3_CACFS|nr:hypothetical protein DFA_11329 [Cavenderia fasciculata]EGG13568.1 hypothetical protein DFA_11329 [Cavenderia fasciculata]|eukprot:XP_004350272.1 hypothetical protein DFA_11329 [Cavenderia fasciculata]
MSLREEVIETFNTFIKSYDLNKDGEVCD